jgi:DNA-binding transcriptional MerR regulator/methylmalonyl-CoA mutase cobalamin-binding subunit
MQQRDNGRMPTPEVISASLPIAAVEAECGIPRATLRIWERRYGFPAPGRDARGERSYSPQQVDKLRLMRRLLDLGHRPAPLAEMGMEELMRLASGPQAIRAAGTPPPADAFLKVLQSHDMRALAAHLRRAIDQQGLAAFLTGHLPRLNTAVGNAWSAGDIQVFEEHLYTECVQQVLISAIEALAVPRSARPRVLLATFPQELHGLGLLMARGWLALHGASCSSLGVSVPVTQIAAAAVAQRADVVGLSFAASMHPAHAVRGLLELRTLLPVEVDIWVGGSCPAVMRRKLKGVATVASLPDTEGLLAAWRAAHPSA